MNATSGRSKDMSSPSTPNVIFSPGSPAGVKPCGSPDIQIASLFGLAHVPASPSVRRAIKKESPTSAICGQNSSDLFENADPLGFSANKSPAQKSSELSIKIAKRLQANLGPSGSMEYQQTWKE